MDKRLKTICYQNLHVKYLLLSYNYNIIIINSKKIHCFSLLSYSIIIFSLGRCEILYLII